MWINISNDSLETIIDMLGFDMYDDLIEYIEICKKNQDNPDRNRLRLLAHDRYESDNVQIDDSTVVCEGDGCMWVQAWVRLEGEKLRKDEETAL